MRPVALSIAGSDSGGGAGIQADLRTLSRLGVFGTTALTALTAQNLAGVHAVLGVEPDLVEAQVRAVLDGFDVRAVKTGMLWSADVVERVAAVLGGRRLGERPLVVDPVMVASTGDPLLQPDAVDAYRERLLPICTLMTPNLDEAALLLGRGAIDDPEQAAAELGHRFGCAVLLKGGHLEGDPIDRLWTPEKRFAWRHARVHGVNTHGTGCTLSAAIAARLAMGASLESAVEDGLGFVHDALVGAVELRGARLIGIERATPRAEHLSAAPDIA